MATSIFQVEVDDESFKKFQQDFEKYTVAVNGLPMAWGRIEAAIENVSERIDAQTDALTKAQGATDKATGKQQAYNRALRDTAGAWRTISYWTRTATTDAQRLLGVYGAVTGHITRAAAAMLRWGTVGALGAGLAGAGGLWGISGLAGAAGATRRASLGLGLAPGEMRAFETNFSSMFDVRSVLGNLSSARNDPDRRWALLSMGLDPNASTGDLARQAPLAAKRIYEEGGQSLSYAKARGLLEVFTEDDLQRLHNMTVQEIEASRQMVEQDRRRMEVSDALARRWQSLSVQFDRAGNVIQTVFLDALSPLAPEIEKLSDAFTEAVKTALSLDVMRAAINGLATGIGVAGRYIASAEFLDDIRSFGSAVESVWRAVSRVAAWINGLFPGAGGAAGANAALQGDAWWGGMGGAYYHGMVEREAYAAGALALHRRPSADQIGALGGAPGVDMRAGVDPGAWLRSPINAVSSFADHEARYNLPAGTLDRIWSIESNRGRNMGPSRAGALGHFQFMPATGAQYGLLRPEDFNDLGRSSEAAARYLSDLAAQFRGDIRAAVAAYNWGPANVDRVRRQHGEQWEAHLPRETQDYLRRVVDQLERQRAQPPRVDLRVENEAGARVAVIGAAARAQ